MSRLALYDTLLTRKRVPGNRMVSISLPLQKSGNISLPWRILIFNRVDLLPNNKETILSTICCTRRDTSP
ncbi:unnamed protein product, partial [Rotaria sp. Silwood1]